MGKRRSSLNKAYLKGADCEVRRCVDCNKPLREPKLNKSGYCNSCGARKHRNEHKEYYSKYGKEWRKKQKDDTQRQS